MDILKCNTRLAFGSTSLAPFSSIYASETSESNILMMTTSDTSLLRYAQRHMILWKTGLEIFTVASSLSGTMPNDRCGYCHAYICHQKPHPIQPPRTIKTATLFRHTKPHHLWKRQSSNHSEQHQSTTRCRWQEMHTTNCWWLPILSPSSRSDNSHGTVSHCCTTKHSN